MGCRLFAEPLEMPASVQQQQKQEGEPDPLHTAAETAVGFTAGLPRHAGALMARQAPNALRLLVDGAAKSGFACGESPAIVQLKTVRCFHLGILITITLHWLDLLCIEGALLSLMRTSQRPSPPSPIIYVLFKVTQCHDLMRQVCRFQLVPVWYSPWFHRVFQWAH